MEVLGHTLLMSLVSGGKNLLFFKYGHMEALHHVLQSNLVVYSGKASSLSALRLSMVSQWLNNGNFIANRCLVDTSLWSHLSDLVLLASRVLIMDGSLLQTHGSCTLV